METEMKKEDYSLKRYGELDIFETFLGPDRDCHICITSRRGGSSFAAGDLNLSIGTGDSDENVLRNRDLVAIVLGSAASDVAGLSQVHGKEILKVENNNLQTFRERKQRADGLLTSLKDQWLSISIGDCQPVVIFDNDRKALCMVHAGWGGTALRIVEEAIGRLKAEGSRSENLYALLGPSIGGGAYQVDERVFKEFAKGWSNWRDFIYDPSDGHGYIDILAANRYLLIKNGVDQGKIVEMELCTWTLPSLFFSHRRDGLPGGRMFAYGKILQ